MLRGDKFKVIKILNRRQHISQVSVLDWKKKKKRFKHEDYFGLLKSEVRLDLYIFNLTTDFSLLSAVVF